MALSLGNILLVEDDRQLSELLNERLKDEGFTVMILQNGKNILQVIEQFKPEVIILDVMLPEISGFDLCRTIREKHPLISILMLTSRTDEIDRVKGLEMGADDYISKPFSYYELIARIRTCLRRSRSVNQRHSENEAEIIFKNIKINTINRQVFIDDEPVTLTAKEFDLLLLLMKNPNRVFTRIQLLETVWHETYEGYDRAVDTTITRLRGKIERNPAEPDYIKTIWGVGYKFIAD